MILYGCRSVAECYHSVVYQTRDHTENLKMVSRRTVGEPCKKLCPEFNNIANALKKRETAIKEYNAAALKHDKASKAAKTGQNVVRLTQAKKALETGMVTIAIHCRFTWFDLVFSRDFRLI